MSRRSILLFTFIFSLGVSAEDSSFFTGPVSGIVFDSPTKSFRAVNGALGSASLGPALLDNLQFGTAAPNGPYGFACQEDQCFIVSGLGSGEISKQLLPNVAIPTGSVWANDGSAVVLYSSTNNWIRVLKGLPGSAELGPIVDTSIGKLSSVAINANGSRTAAAILGEAAGIYELTESGLSRMAALENPVIIAFADARGSLFVCDSTAKTLGELNLSTMALESASFEALADPVAVRFAVDPTNRQILYVAGRKDRALIAYDTSTREVVVKIDLEADPLTIDPLRRGGFLLGGRLHDGEPLWGFDTNSELKLYFVPAPVLSQEAGAQ